MALKSEDADAILFASWRAWCANSGNRPYNYPFEEWVSDLQKSAALTDLESLRYCHAGFLAGIEFQKKTNAKTQSR